MSSTLCSLSGSLPYAGNPVMTPEEVQGLDEPPELIIYQ